MNKLKLLLVCVVMLPIVNVWALDPVLVTENTFKLKGEEHLFFGFASGDDIVFDFQEANGKNVKEVEIIELPNNTKYQDFKTSAIRGKTIHVYSTGLYEFRFKNPAIASRVCKVKIERIPADESKIHFDTGWRYEYVRDTTYVPYTEDSIVGYKQVTYTEYVRELASTETEEYVLMDNVVVVKSRGIVQHDNPREVVTFSMPTFPYDPNKERKVVSWAFWMATGNNAESFWNKNKEKMASALSSAIGFSTPLGALATGALFDLATPAPGTNNSVRYYIADMNNSQLFLSGAPQFNIYHEGSGSGAFSRFTDADMMQGMYGLCLYNPNLHERIRVMAKVSAIVETKTYKKVPYERIKSVPQYVTLHKKRMVVNERRIMVMNGTE